MALWEPEYPFPFGNKDFRYIAHRGNTTGPSPEFENNPEYIQEALNDGFDVEVDVWFNGSVDKNYYSGLYLGHDRPQYKIDFKFLQDKRIWAHAKNFEALDVMLKQEKIHCFWHQNDDYTFTSQGYVWTYPQKQLTSKSIRVSMEKDFGSRKIYEKMCAGICTDFLK